MFQPARWPSCVHALGCCGVSGTAAFYGMTILRDDNVGMEGSRSFAAFLDHCCHCAVTACMQVLRMVQGLLDQMPTMSSDEFESEVATERADVALVSLLCMITKGIESCHTLATCTSEAFVRR